MPNKEDQHADGATATNEGQWTTIVRKTRSKKGITHPKDNMKQSPLSKAAETRQLLKAMEYTLDTGTRLNTMSARSQAAYKQTLKKLKEEASRDYMEVGRLATRVYGTDVKRTRNRHLYSAALYDFVSTFNYQVTRDKGGSNKARITDTADSKEEAPDRNSFDRTPGVEEHKEIEPEDDWSTQSTPQRGGQANKETPQNKEQQGKERTAWKAGTMLAGTMPVPTESEDTENGGVDTEEGDDEDATTVYTTTSQQSATRRMQENFAATEKVLDAAVNQVHIVDGAQGTARPPMTDIQVDQKDNTNDRHEREPEEPTEQEDMVMELTYIQDKLRMRTEEIKDLKQLITQMRETMMNMQHGIDNLQQQVASQHQLQEQVRSHTVTLETLQQHRRATDQTLQQQQGMMSALDVDQGALKNAMEAAEAGIAIVTSKQREQEDKMLTKEEHESRIHQVMRSQIQGQTKEVVKVVYAACKDQFAMACQRVQEATIARLRPEAEKIYTSTVANIQEDGERIYKTIVEAGEETQEANIQMLDAAAATYESEIHDARQAELTHFTKEIQNLVEKQDLHNVRHGVLRLQRGQKELIAQQSQQVTTMEKQIQAVADNAHRNLTREVEQLRQEARGQQTMESMRQDVESEALKIMENKFRNRTEQLEKDIRETIAKQQDTQEARWATMDSTMRTAQETTTMEMTQLQELYEQVQKAQEEWKDYCRQEMQDHKQAVETHMTRVATQVATQQPTEQTGQQEQDQRPTFRGHPINLGSARPEAPGTEGIQFGAARPPPTPENHMTGEQQYTTGRTADQHQLYSSGTQEVDREQQQLNRGLLKEIHRFKKDEMVFDLPMDDSLPPQKMMEGNYKMFHNSVAAYGFPILAFQELEAHSHTTLPPDADRFYDKETIHLIATAIYLKLNVIIPPMNEQLRVILHQEADSQDGYRALFELMQLTCDHLRIIRQPWGPKWQGEMTIHAYFSQLQSKIHNERRQGRQYTPMELAAEFLQQAIRHPQYVLTASHMLTELRGIALQRKPLPPHLELPNIMATYQNISTMVIAQTPQTPSIHKLQGWPGTAEHPVPAAIHQTQAKHGESNWGGRGKPQRARNSVQCPACMKFGHTVDSQICHFAAQTVHAQQWIQQNKEAASSNAQAYKLSNAPRTIKQMEARFDNLFTQDMTEEEKQEVRDAMISTFTHGPSTTMETTESKGTVADPRAENGGTAHS